MVRRHFTRSRSFSQRRRPKSDYWIPLMPTATMLAVSHAAPAIFKFGIQNLLSTMYNATANNATILRIVGTLTMDSNAAYAATAIDTLVVGLIVDDVNGTAAQLDPTAAGNQRNWMQQWYHHQPFNAAPLQAYQTLEMKRDIDLRVKRVIREANDDLMIVGATLFPTATTSAFNVNFTGRALVRCP